VRKVAYSVQDAPALVFHDDLQRLLFRESSGHNYDLLSVMIRGDKLGADSAR
jgi:hypothetical protein